MFYRRNFRINQTMPKRMPPSTSRTKLAISMTDYEAFSLGDNVAATPGKVVFQNDLMQLLQYTPTTTEVYRTPLVICPPWIRATPCS